MTLLSAKSPHKKRLAILISGRGSNMDALARACAQPDFPAQVAVVISNVDTAPGIRLAGERGLAAHVCAHKAYPDKASFEQALVALIKSYDADIVCLAGFMRVLGPTYFTLMGGIPTLNIHPSLLPKHKGLHTHQAALDAGDSIHGCTVHMVNEGLDDGPIIMQRTMPVLPGDTPETLAERMLPIEHALYPEAVRAFIFASLQAGITHPS